MDFETLERLWRSQADAPTVAEAYILETTMKTLKQRRDAFTFGMGLVGLAMIVWTGAILYAQFIRGVVDPGREWGVYLMLAVAWIAYLSVQHQYRRHLRAWRDTDASMPQALNALLDENRTARARMRLLAVALIVFCAAIALSLSQLHDVGKMEPQHVLQGSILFGGAMLLSAVIQAIRYFAVLRPEAARLRHLLSQYDG
jgi:ferric-dicitrate binding protein FerR (iron transport regulator)